MRIPEAASRLGNELNEQGESPMEIGNSGWKRIALGGQAEKPAGDGGKASRDAASPATFIDQGCEFQGKLSLNTSIRMDGEYRGHIVSEDTVVVGETAALEASIEARTVVICGAVVGDVEASREVVIHATGRLHGNVKTPSLVIERGAFFNGETRMYRPEVIARKNAVADEPSRRAATAD
jgi:cytoskeletal protein CcmA (bactofilin family)